MATERELFQLLSTAPTLAGVEVRWGWKALESATQIPSLPLVTLQRSVASVAYGDMCVDRNPKVDTTLQVHVWVKEYEAARALNAQVRSVILNAGGWALQAELDDYEPSFAAWRISGEYLGAGMAAE
jgi:hypothetical protein